MFGHRRAADRALSGQPLARSTRTRRAQRRARAACPLRQVEHDHVLAMRRPHKADGDAAARDRAVGGREHDGETLRAADRAGAQARREQPATPATSLRRATATLGQSGIAPACVAIRARTRRLTRAASARCCARSRQFSAADRARPRHRRQRRSRLIEFAQLLQTGVMPMGDCRRPGSVSFYGDDHAATARDAEASGQRQVAMRR